MFCCKDNINKLETVHLCDMLCLTAVREMKSTGVLNLIERDAT